MSRTPRRHLVALVVLALLCSSVWFAPEPDTAPTSDEAVARLIVPPPVDPGGDPAQPRADRSQPSAGPAEAPPPREPVAVQQARIRVDEVEHGALEAALGVQGVTFATVIALGEVAIGEPGGAHLPLRVAMVDPAGFRVLTPQITADALDLWDRLAAGEAVFTHEHAQRLLLHLGSHVPLGEGLSVRVGAFATHATPPVADAIVDAGTGDRLGLGDAPRSLLVAVDPELDPESIARDLERELGKPATVIEDPRVPRMLKLEGLTTPENVWDRLAWCESSGDWHINTGNGYYGGLQFLPESWFLVGGTGMPHEASREEQILRAEKLLAIQGWEAWPVCSILIGLRPGPLPERYRQGTSDDSTGAPTEEPPPAEETDEAPPDASEPGDPRPSDDAGSEERRLPWLPTP